LPGSPLNYRKVHWTFLPIGAHSARLLEFVSSPKKYRKKGYHKGILYFLAPLAGLEPATTRLTVGTRLLKCAQMPEIRHFPLKNRSAFTV
jgi:hypothetical protein